MEREVREITSHSAWLTWREGDWTASRIAALFGAHPYLSLDDVAAIMRRTTGSGAGSIPPDSAAMRRGRILEPGVAAAIAEDRPDWRLQKATTYHRLPDYRLGCTPDYWANNDGLIQIKTCAPTVWDKWHGHPPLGYTLQTLTELLVTGRAWGVLAVMVTNHSYPVYYFDVPRHEAAERRILGAVSAWWQAWDQGQMPGATSSAELAAALDDGSHRDLSEDNLLPSILPERATLKATVSEAEKRLKTIDYEIKNRLGPARTGWLPGWSLSFDTVHRRDTIIPASDYRVLRVKAIEEEPT